MKMENILSIHNDVICVGEGTVESPYLISNAAQLDWFRDQVNGGENSIHGALTVDITYNAGTDVAGYGDALQGLAEFTPIASGSAGYKGTFDGRGHVISGLYVNWDGSPWCGLFGQVTRDGVVKDVILRNSYFRTSYRDENGSVHLGGIAGRNSGTISGCDVRATIVAASDLSGIECSVISCGGIVGSDASSGTVSGCKSSGSVDVSGTAMGNINCGGIVGYDIGLVRDCMSRGSALISGRALSHRCCGGIVGACEGTGTVKDCVSPGSGDMGL